MHIINGVDPGGGREEAGRSRKRGNNNQDISGERSTIIFF